MMKRFFAIAILVSLFPSPKTLLASEPTLRVLVTDGNKNVVEELPLEDYLAGVVKHEMSPTWPAESLKAQTIAARTYALTMKERNRTAKTGRTYDVTSTMFDQVYQKTSQGKSTVTTAVAATRGLILKRDGRTFLTYYHSCCGGETEYAANVWPGSVPTRIAMDPYCARSPKLTWEYRLPTKQFMATLNAQGTHVQNIASLATTTLPHSRRVDMLLIDDGEGMKMVRATDLRRIFGYANLKSTWFNVGLERNEVVFAGRGYGHGVGLCQWGAKGMAEAGKMYQDILKFYYPDAEIASAY
ncbi:MAG: SpoIID/LytB domain-containing protein [Deltaproteobacteria bacterium]|nr:SpoIID/LytB domain-containing protein [Deltaproteobacteria bacterium]